MTRKLFYALFIALFACSAVNVWANADAKSKKKRDQKSDIESISKKMHGVWMMQCTKTDRENEFKPMEGFMKVFLEDGTFTNFQVSKEGVTTSLSGHYSIENSETYIETFEYRVNDDLEGNKNILKFHFEGPNKLHLFWKLNVEDGTTKGEILVEEIWIKVTAPKVEQSKKKTKKK